MASLYKRGKTWYVKYYINERIVRKAASRDKRTALEYKAQLETQLSRKQLALPIYKYSWEDFIKKYLAYSSVEKSERTLTLDTLALKSFAVFSNPKTMGDISKEILEDWRNNRIKQAAPTTVNIELRQIKASFNKAVEWGLMDPKQFKGVGQVKVMKRLPRFLSLDEIDKLREVMPLRWWRMFYIMICTGLRLGEFVHLKWSHVDIGRNVIRVAEDGEWVPKDFEMREIPLRRDATTMLIAMKRENYLGDYVFHNGSPNNTLKRRLNRKFHLFCSRAGIAKCRIHDLRHTFASHLVMEGVDLLTVRDLLGHSSVKTTEIYAHLSPAFRQKAVEKLKYGAQIGAQRINYGTGNTQFNVGEYLNQPG